MATLDDYRAGAEPKQKEKNDTEARLEGTLELLPHCDYSAGQSYGLSGLGSVFNGAYKLKKVTHTYNASGYTVNADVYRRLSGGAAAGAAANPEAPRKETGTTKLSNTTADDEEYNVVVNKKTGSVSGT